MITNDINPLMQVPTAVIICALEAGEKKKYRQLDVITWGTCNLNTSGESPSKYVWLNEG